MAPAHARPEGAGGGAYQLGGAPQLACVGRRRSSRESVEVCRGLVEQLAGVRKEVGAGGGPHAGVAVTSVRGGPSRSRREGCPPRPPGRRRDRRTGRHGPAGARGRCRARAGEPVAPRCPAAVPRTGECPEGPPVLAATAGGEDPPSCPPVRRRGMLYRPGRLPPGVLPRIPDAGNHPARRCPDRRGPDRAVAQRAERRGPAGGRDATGPRRGTPETGGVATRALRGAPSSLGRPSRAGEVEDGHAPGTLSRSSLWSFAGDGNPQRAPSARPYLPGGSRPAGSEGSGAVR